MKNPKAHKACDITQKLDSELSSLKPDIKEICKMESNILLSH